MRRSLPILDRPRRENGGNGTGEAREKRHERLAVEADARHQAIDHEGDAREVPGVLEDRDEEEEQRDLRHEDDHVADARDDAVDEQIAHRSFGEAPRGSAPARRRSASRSRSINGSAHEKSDWKTTSITTANTRRPSTGCVSTRSTLSVRLVRGDPDSAPRGRRPRRRTDSARR